MTGSRDARLVVPPRKSFASRMFDLFHTHPQGRLFEFLFFAALGGVFLAIALVGRARKWFPEEIAWLIGLVGICLILFAMLPQKKRAPPPPPPKGKRGEIAEKVKASKAEKRKGPPPPIQ